jgi:deoxyribose-phosphate aldolase
MIDHTLLKPEATRTDVLSLCAEAVDLAVVAICVSPSMLPLPSELLAHPAGGRVEVCTVIGFPSGAHRLRAKQAEAEVAVADGADELDLVIDLGLARSGRWSDVEAEIAAVRTVAAGSVLKVIIESSALTDDEIVSACRAAEAAGADFVKTSTGFHPTGGATVHAVTLMRSTVGDRLGVKASGGIRTTEAALAMIEAGASRLGCSASAAILAGL